MIYTCSNSLNSVIAPPYESAEECRVDLMIENLERENPK